MKEREYRHHRRVTRLMVLNHALLVIAAVAVVVGFATSYGVALHHLMAPITDFLQVAKGGR